jgi:hypothetical protein
MSDKEQGPGRGEGNSQGPAKEGGLGILFVGAAVGLALILSLVGLLGYFAMSR